MPSWCNNDLCICGNSTELKRFKENVYRGKHFFHSFVPMPEEIANTRCPNLDKKRAKELRIRYGYDNWYDWAFGEWGTSRDVDLENFYKSSCLFTCIFAAWDPPVAWLKKVAKQFPKLTFELFYEEEGVGFAGLAVGKNGKVEDFRFLFR